MATTNKNRTTLVNGCGTILKENRLKGGYKLVKRKRVKGASASAKTKEVVKTTEKVVLTAPVGKVGRPKKVKEVVTATATIKTKAKAKAKANPRAKGKNEYFDKMNKARKEGASSFEYKGKTFVASKTKTGVVVYKSKPSATATAPATTKKRAGRKTTASASTMKAPVKKTSAKRKKRIKTAKA